MQAKLESESWSTRSCGRTRTRWRFGRRYRGSWRGEIGERRSHNPGGGYSSDVRAEAELLEGRCVELARGVYTIGGLEFLDGGDGIRVPFAARIALIVACARESGLYLGNALRRGRLLKCLAFGLMAVFFRRLLCCRRRGVRSRTRLSRAVPGARHTRRAMRPGGGRRKASEPQRRDNGQPFHLRSHN